MDLDRVKKLGWKELDRDEHLARLHRRFWGQELEAKAKEPPTSDPSGSGQKDETADDTDESDLEDDDITPDCFDLDLGIRRVNKLWVRVSNCDE